MSKLEERDVWGNSQRQEDVRTVSQCVQVECSKRQKQLDALQVRIDSYQKLITSETRRV